MSDASKGKRGQTYHLTATGKEQRKRLAQLRIDECEQDIQSLKSEIATLKQEI